MRGQQAKRDAQERRLRSAFFRLRDAVFGGYVFDEDDLERRFAVELLLDGLPYKLVRAEAYSPELMQSACGDGFYGFYVSIAESALAECRTIEARIANTGFTVGNPLSLETAKSLDDQRGDTRWLGGLRFQGWTPHQDFKGPTIQAVIDGETVAEARGWRWTHVAEGTPPVLGFDLQLPQRFADGCARKIRFIRGGQELASSPLTFIAYADGLTQTLERLGEVDAERPRAQLFDRLLPMSIPFAEYADWQQRFPMAAPEVVPIPTAIVVIGSADEQISLKSIKSQDYPSWVIALLPEAGAQVQFNPDQLSKFLSKDAADAQLVLFALSGTHLANDALKRVVGAFEAYPQAIAVYGDIDVEMPASVLPSSEFSPLKTSSAPGVPFQNQKWPIAFSAFDYERMLEQAYCAHFFALRASAVRDALARGASDLYRMFNAPLDADLNAQIIHIPGPLATLPRIELPSANRVLTTATGDHLRARGIAAEVLPGEGRLFPRARVERSSPRPPISIIIPVRNRLALLQSCLQSIWPAVRSEGAQVIIADNDSSDPEMLAYLANPQFPDIQVLHVPGTFNFARLNNVAAVTAKADVLCLLNNDIEATDELWLREMSGRLSEPNVGAVGALLTWPSGVVQHGGVVLGPSFAAAHAFNDRILDDPGYSELLRVAHEVSSVTAACLLTRRQDYLETGGMDEVHFPVNFNDVDYCLKLRSAGKRIVFTPHARLLHLESASRGTDATPDRAARFQRELRSLRDRWGHVLECDPYYSPLLSLDPVPFSALAWPPRGARPRTNEQPKGLSLPPGL